VFRVVERLWSETKLHGMVEKVSGNLDWETTFLPDNDTEWNTYVEDNTTTTTFIQLPLPVASKNEQEIHEQQVYLQRLASASKRLAKKKKRQKRTFVQALKNLSTSAEKSGLTVLDNSAECDDSAPAITTEEDDRPLLEAHRQNQSHPSSLDLELIRSPTLPSWCERCEQCACNSCKNACVVS